MTKRGKLKWGG